MEDTEHSDGKKSISALAYFGGRPVFPTQVHVGRPNIAGQARFFELAGDIFNRCWLTNAGPLVQELERRIAGYAGVRHCVAMCNGTIALEVLVRALGLSGEVIVPSYTFVASAHALQWLNVTPVFADIDPLTHNLDPEQVERLITKHTTGILGVHLWGRGCEVGALEDIARRHKLRLFFDAAHAFGCSKNGRKIGGFGQAEVFSFHATKFFNTFEGGAVVTNDDDLAQLARRMHNFGFAGYDNVVSIGTNGKMSEIAAAMGLAALDSVPEFIAANRRNYLQYRAELASVPAIKVLEYDEKETNNFQYIVAEIDERLPLSRDSIVAIMHAENILCRRYFYPCCHRMEPYRSLPRYRDVSLPQSEKVAARVLVLPTGTTLGEEQIGRITGIMRFLVEHADEVARAVKQRPG